MGRWCEFCGELYGERDCPRCSRGMCDRCDTGPECWDCEQEPIDEF